MPPLVLGDQEVQQLQGIASSRSLPHSIVQPAQIVLACGAGETKSTAIARDLPQHRARLPAVLEQLVAHEPQALEEGGALRQLWIACPTRL